MEIKYIQWINEVIMKSFIEKRFLKEPVCEPPITNTDSFGIGTPYWNDTVTLTVSDIQTDNTFSIRSEGLNRDQVKSILKALDMNILNSR